MDLRYHPAAEDELDEAIAWYEADYEGRGRRFADAFEAAVLRIRGAPHTFPAWRRRQDVRFLTVPKFPYSVIFRTEDEGVMIYAVAHHRRRPGYWLKRLQAR